MYRYFEDLGYKILKSGKYNKVKMIIQSELSKQITFGLYDTVIGKTYKLVHKSIYK